MKKEKKENRYRKYFVLPLCMALGVLLSGYTALAGVRVIADSRPQTGGDVFGSQGTIEFDVFGNMRPGPGKEPVIKPGSEGTYSFAIKNQYETPMDVFFGLSDENVHQIPMVYRLKTGEQYLLGDEKSWVDGTALREYEIKDALPGNVQRDYQLDWSWQDGLGAEADKKDTELGNRAARGEAVTYTLQLALRMEQEMPKPPEETEQEGGHDEGAGEGHGDEAGSSQNGVQNDTQISYEDAALPQAGVQDGPILPQEIEADGETQQENGSYPAGGAKQEQSDSTEQEQSGDTEKTDGAQAATENGLQPEEKVDDTKQVEVTEPLPGGNRDWPWLLIVITISLIIPALLQKARRTGGASRS